jgi:predicted DsbA family dithiol-disulfide isomerase
MESSPRILVWSDYIWPFCYVGLERAAWLERQFGAEIEWRPFQLHPEYPPEGSRGRSSSGATGTG